MSELGVKIIDDGSLALLAQKKGVLAEFLEEHGNAACHAPLSNLQIVFRTEIRYAEMLCVAETDEEKVGIISARNEYRLGNIAIFDEVLERTAQFKERAIIALEASDDPQTTYLRALGKVAVGHDTDALAIVTTAPLNLRALRSEMVSTTE